MWIIPRPHYSVSSLWNCFGENDFFQLLKIKPNDSLLGKLSNLAVTLSDQQPLTYRIIYKSKPHHMVIAVSNSLDIMKGHWKLLIDEIIIKISECDIETREQFIITKISGMANCFVEEEEDQNDQSSLREFKTQFDIDEKLVTYFTCTLPNGNLKPSPGKMFITENKICYFTANHPITRIMIPFDHVNSISKETSLGFLPGAIKIKANIGPDDKTVSEFFFHFIPFLRDQAYDILEQLWQYSMDELFELTNNSGNNNVDNSPTSTTNMTSSSSYNDLQSISSSGGIGNDDVGGGIQSPILKPKTRQLLAIEKKNKDFQRVFKLPMDEELVQVHTCWIVRSKGAILGELYISPNFFSIKLKERFTAKKLTTVIHVSQVESIQKTRPFLGISVITDSLVVTVKSGRSIVIRLFHCDEALTTMKKYCQLDNHNHDSNNVDNITLSTSPNYKEKLRLETIGTNLFSQEPSIIIEDEKIEKKKFELWDNYFKKNGMDTTMSITRQLKKLTQLGIPEFFRGQIWSFSSGACHMWEKERGYYDNLLATYDQCTNNDELMTQAIEDIEKDVRRTFSHHPYFKDNGPGVDSLRRVLIAYSIRNPTIGYCQGMNIVAGIMLLYMKEEAAFWVLSKVVEYYLCDYYSKEMIGSLVDQTIFEDLCKLYIPDVHKHLDRIGLPVKIISIPWFICLFVSYIPYPVSTRVIDSLLLTGTTVLFQVGLAILKINKNEILAEKESEVVIELIRNKKYNVDELIDVTFQDFDILDDKISELRNSLKFTEIKKNHRIKMRILNSNNSSAPNTPTTTTTTSTNSPLTFATPTNN